MQQLLANLNVQNRLRKLKPCVDHLVDFASNDYLGLAKEARPLSGGGSTGSRLLTGHRKIMETVEEKIAQYHRVEAALVYPCGYMANIGLLSAVARSGHVILYDADVHVSVRDGARLSQAPSFPFRHQDLDHLEKRLKAAKKQAFVCVSSVYSMSGDLAPLDDLTALCKRYDALLVVDEAHAMGVLGEKGRGLCDTAFAKIVTFGKGLGCYGAAVLGSRVLCDVLINISRTFIYTTALPPALYETIGAMYDRLPHLDDRRSRIQVLISHFSSSKTHIQTYYTPHAKELSARLAKEGFDARAIRSPTVKKGAERIRICLHSYNTQSEVKALCRLLS